jgi:hypothetical protein
VGCKGEVVVIRGVTAESPSLVTGTHRPPSGPPAADHAEPLVGRSGVAA